MYDVTITLSGNQGTGKSTLMKIIINALELRGYKIHDAPEDNTAFNPHTIIVLNPTHKA